MVSYIAELELELALEGGQSFISCPGATLEAAVPGSFALPGGRLLVLPGANSLALVGHSIELEELLILDVLLALDAESAVANVGPSRPTARPPTTTARAAPGSVICILHLLITPPIGEQLRTP